MGLTSVRWHFFVYHGFALRAVCLSLCLPVCQSARLYVCVCVCACLCLRVCVFIGLHAVLIFHGLEPPRTPARLLATRAHFYTGVGRAGLGPMYVFRGPWCFAALRRGEKKK